MFRFKQFTIRQETVSMKVGTDAVLLGSWADISNARSAIDIGTGSGILALMLAQRNTGVIIDGIDIMESAVKQARENADLSPWGSRIHIICSDVKEYCNATDKNYDYIICNPPYYSLGFPVKNKERNAARVAENMDQGKLLFAVNSLLSSDGKFGLILPYSLGKNFIMSAQAAGLFCNRKTSVQSKPRKQAIRLLMEFTRKRSITQDDHLVIHTESEKEYTEAYKQLTRPFYLNF